MPTDWPPLNTHPPFVRVLLSDFVTMPPMSWHGKAEEPMVLGGREGSAVALDARQPSLWTSVVRQGVVCSCAAVADVFWQLSAAMRHAGLVGTAAAGDVAEPMQIEPYAVGIGPLGSKFTVLSVCGACVAISSRRRDLWVLWSFGGICEVRRGALAPPLRLHTP